MFYEKLKDFLKNIKIWIVTDNGWYYSYPIAVTFNFEEAKQIWEEKTNLNWDMTWEKFLTQFTEEILATIEEWKNEEIN